MNWLKRLAFPAFLLAVIAAMSWVMLTNYRQVEQLKSDGRDPITVATPGVDGQPGPAGPQGPQGEPGTDGLNGLDGADGTDGKAGLDGRDGADGDDGATGPAGPQGPKGADGATGTKGTDARTPTFACVMRWDANLSTVTRYYFAWKYTDEPNTAYRDISRINSNDRLASGCVDLRA